MFENEITIHQLKENQSGVKNRKQDHSASASTLLEEEIDTISPLPRSKLTSYVEFHINFDN